MEIPLNKLSENIKILLKLEKKDQKRRGTRGVLKHLTFSMIFQKHISPIGVLKMNKTSQSTLKTNHSIKNLCIRCAPPRLKYIWKSAPPRYVFSHIAPIKSITFLVFRHFFVKNTIDYRVKKSEKVLKISMFLRSQF